MMVFMIFIGAACSPAVAHLSLNFTTAGFDPMLVATGLSAYGFVLIISKLIYGKISDKLGSRVATIIFGLIVVAGLLLTSAAGVIGSRVYLFGTFAVLAIGYPVATLGYPIWAADFSSADDYAKTLKRFQIGYQAGAMIGSPIPGIIADATGSYSLAYVAFAVIFAIAIVGTFIIYGKVKKMRKTLNAGA